MRNIILFILALLVFPSIGQAQVQYLGSCGVSNNTAANLSPTLGRVDYSLPNTTRTYCERWLCPARKNLCNNAIEYREVTYQWPVPDTPLAGINSNGVIAIENWNDKGACPPTGNSNWNCASARVETFYSGCKAPANFVPAAPFGGDYGGGGDNSGGGGDASPPTPPSPPTGGGGGGGLPG